MVRSALLAALFSVLAGLAVWGSLGIGITTGLGISVLLLGSACAAFVGIFFWRNTPVWRDVNAGVVSSIEGMVGQSEQETDIRTGPLTKMPIWSYCWTVDGTQRFLVTGKAYAALAPARHRIYFLPQSRRVIAAEPIITSIAV